MNALYSHGTYFFAPVSESGFFRRLYFLGSFRLINFGSLTPFPPSQNLVRRPALDTRPSQYPHSVVSDRHNCNYLKLSADVISCYYIINNRETFELYKRREEKDRRLKKRSCQTRHLPPITRHPKHHQVAVHTTSCFIKINTS